MISVAPGTKVHLACRPISMRYGFDGLAAHVAHLLGADPFSGHLFSCVERKLGVGTVLLRKPVSGADLAGEVAALLDSPEAALV